MTIKNRKLLVFVIGMVVISGAFVGVIFVAPTQLGVFIPWFIIGLIFLSALFVGGNVWKAYITSKYFKPELAETVEKITQ